MYAHYVLPSYATPTHKHTKQLKVVQSSELVMHMLVLYGNTGCKMDLSTGGYTVAIIRKMLPACVYTPCIEEHNIHAIFRWSSVFPILEASQSTTTQISLALTHDTVKDPSTASSTVDFLTETGLTLSITTLGTCIYRFGKKRNREIYDRATHENHTESPQVAHYSAETEARIFKMCKYIHNIIATS